MKYFTQYSDTNAGKFCLLLPAIDAEQFLYKR
ncbi:hypothetical protein SAMN05216361_1163 [Marisediminitalea aggregata]|uniref:Uncharacterized protein n=1 Tax=Marisediminitalea aggregata TaxID=634436 RepID=A0A1M5GTF1_9ALTE|nr:hypothetical protein SAMN05216361_1163 [Marisediminitalea aggregata]